MIIFSGIRRAAVVAGCAAALSLGLLGAVGSAQAQTAPGASSSPARFAAEATGYQNAVIAKAMARTSGGTRVSPGEVTWHGGAVILSVPATAGASARIADPAEPDSVGPCPGGYFCIWTGKDYGGFGEGFLNAPAWSVEVGLVVADYWVPWGYCAAGVTDGCDVGEHSFVNESGYRTWLEQDQDSGHEGCISSGAANDDYTGVNDLDYWILMTTNSSQC